MAKSEKPASGQSTTLTQAKAGKDGATGKFLEAAKTYRTANTASKEVATNKLKELGIVTPKGKLSKNYR